MRLRAKALAVIAAASVALHLTARAAAERQTLSGHVPPAVAGAQSVEPMPKTKRLDLILGLPLRNQQALTDLLEQLYDPSSTNYHHYLSVEQITERFGPTSEDCQAVAQFAQTNGLTVVRTHPNRTLIEVNGLVEDVERTFHVNMHLYPHPMEARKFYAPDVEPSVDVGLPLLAVSGLNDFIIGRHRSATVTALDKVPSGTRRHPPHSSKGGSGPWGTYISTDYRNAYIPGVSLTGAGQAVGVLAFEGYYSNDIVAYATISGLPFPAVSNVLVSGSGAPSLAGETPMDIEQVLAMAPAATVFVYEGDGSLPNLILNRMYTDNIVRQITDSFVYNWDANTMQIYQQLGAHGVSYFMASGDFGSSEWEEPLGPPYVTSVGGTTLTTDAAGVWVSETAWRNDTADWQTGGGSTPHWLLPSWQMGIDMSSNQGSLVLRNFPDVAMVAENIFGVTANGQLALGHGTSFAAPLWAGLTALVNQQAAQAGYQPVGFANPALYAMGKGTAYNSYFHDITTGNSTNSVYPDRYFAVPGYDLCTGWGTPKGASLINALSGTGGATWVDFGNVSVGDGTYDRPFSTMAQATNFVPSGGVIAIKTPGTTPEVMRISKSMMIRALGGAATIGR